MGEWKPNLYKHLIEAIKAHSNGYYLASALIAAKVICFFIDRIPDKEDEEKADFLVRKN